MSDLVTKTQIMKLKPEGALELPNSLSNHPTNEYIQKLYGSHKPLKREFHPINRNDPYEA